MTLRARLVAVVVVAVALALGAAGVATYKVFTRSLIDQVDARLDQTAVQVAVLIARRPTDLAGEIRLAAPGAVVQVTSGDGTSVATVDAQRPDDDDDPQPAGGQELAGELEALRDAATDVVGYDTVEPGRGDEGLRVRTERLEAGLVLQVGTSLHEADESSDRLISVQATSAAVALVVATLLGFVLVTVGLRPLRRTERAALAIAEGGDLDIEAPGATDATEVGRVALAVNTMLAGIRGAFAERDATEAALRTSEARMGQLVADVSHELRTPLAAVGAYVELIDRGARGEPADLDRALAGVATETARMAALVDQLLLLARIDQHRLPAFELVDLSEVVIEAVAMAHAVDARYPVELRVDQVAFVQGDGAQLRQVIDNLLANVRAHTPPATRTHVRLTAGDGEAVLTVADDGPGGTPEQAARAFERFYRVDDSRSRASGGTGLGLAIVRSVVEAHGGAVEATTGPGAGWTARVMLPLSPSPAGDAA